MNARRIAGLGALIALAAAFAFALRELPWLPRLWTVVLLVALPALAIIQARALGSMAELPRVPVYLSSILSLSTLALVSLLVAHVGEVSDATLSLQPVSVRATAIWAVGCTLAGLAFVWILHALGVRENAILRQLLPTTTRERAWFAALSFAAGLFEELVFRGFLLGMLWLASGSPALAVLISAAVFGIVHGYQGVRGTARAAFLGLILSAPVIATGSLIPAMIAHVALDLILGMVLGERLTG